ncbi:MFS transporter [Streptomyces cremeus]|uniref:MFS transporter n=1 Tax=Streptomyces cremeus TaxID=66881 RepID=A0ABV5PLQ1_STRCM
MSVEPTGVTESARPATGHPPAVAAGLGFTLLSNAGLAMVLTLLPVAVLHGGRIDPTVFSFALSVHVGSALVGAVCTPLVFGRLHPAWTLTIASALKAAGFAAVVVTTADPALFLFAVLAGLGVGVSRPAVRSLLTGAAGGRRRSQVFQVFFIFLNVAYVLAPVAAGPVGRAGVPALVVLVAVELAVGVAVGLLGRGLLFEVPARGTRGFGASLTMLKNRAVAVVLAYTFAIYFAMGFLYAMVLLYEVVNPAQAEHRTLFLSYQPLAIIAIQLALLPFFARLPRGALYMTVAVAGGVGLVLSFTSGLVVILAGLTLFAVAECLAFPKIQVEAADTVPPGQLTQVFALVSVVTAVGEIIGNMTAGLLVGGAASGLPAPAHSGMAVGLLVGLVLLAAGIGVTRCVAPDRPPGIPQH